jgi:hypothetical protein
MCYGFTRIIPCFKFDQRNTTSAPILQKTHIPPKYKTLIIFCDICIYNMNIASSNTIDSVLHTLKKKGGRRGHDRMVVGFTTNCAISAYHH